LLALGAHPFLHISKVVQIWPGLMSPDLHTNSPGHIWTTLYIWILPSHVRYGLPRGFFPLGFPTKNSVCIYLLPHWLAYQLPCPSHPWFNQIIFCEQYKSQSPLLCSILIKQEGQNTYKRNIEAYSWSYCCRGQVVLHIRSDVFVTVVVQRTKCVRRITSPMACLAVPYFWYCHSNGTTFLAGWGGGGGGGGS